MDDEFLTQDWLDQLEMMGFFETDIYILTFGFHGHCPIPELLREGTISTTFPCQFMTNYVHALKRWLNPLSRHIF